MTTTVAIVVGILLFCSLLGFWPIYFKFRRNRKETITGSTRTSTLPTNREDRKLPLSKGEIQHCGVTGYEDFVVYDASTIGSLNRPKRPPPPPPVEHIYESI